MLILLRVSLFPRPALCDLLIGERLHVNKAFTHPSPPPTPPTQGVMVRGVILVNPHNPLADIYTPQEMAGFLEFAKRSAGSPSLITIQHRPLERAPALHEQCCDVHVWLRARVAVVRDRGLITAAYHSASCCGFIISRHLMSTSSRRRGVRVSPSLSSGVVQ